MSVYKKILLLLVLIIVASCRRQLVQMGYVNLEVDKILQMNGFNWKIAEGEKEFQVYFESRFPDERDDIVDDIEDAYNDVMEFTSFSEPENSIHIFLVSDIESVKKISGNRREVDIISEHHIILMVYQYNFSEDNYEASIASLLALKQWGDVPLWMNEGYGHYISQREGDDDVDLSPALIEKAINEKFFQDYEEFSFAERSKVGANFVSYIITEYGEDLFKSLWSMEDKLMKERIDEWQVRWRASLNKKGG